MNKRCIQNQMKNESAEEFIMGLTHIEDQINSTRLAALIGMIFSIIGFIIAFGFGIAKICCDNDISIALYICGFIFVFLPALIVGSIIVAKINSRNFDLTQLAQPGCTDNITASALKGFTSKVSSAKSMAASYLSFGIIGICTFVLLLIFP